MKRLIVDLVVGMICAGVGLSAASAEKPAGRLLKPCVVITGADSHLAARRYLRITSADDWARVWQEHKGQKVTEQYDRFYDPLTLPLIDFHDYMVIGIFQGSGSNNAGLRAVSILEEKSRIVFRFGNKFYQTAGPGGGGEKAAVYGFFVVPRSTKPVVLEESAPVLKGQPPEWKQRITFPQL
jgi:hypothetical protein